MGLLLHHNKEIVLVEAKQKKVKKREEDRLCRHHMLTNQLMNAIKPILGMAKVPNETWS